jgi:hypothetical protein
MAGIGKLGEVEKSQRTSTNGSEELFDQEMLLSVFQSPANRIKCVTKHEGKYCTQ